jgi:hypothetical protein
MNYLTSKDFQAEFVLDFIDILDQVGIRTHLVFLDQQVFHCLQYLASK